MLRPRRSWMGANLTLRASPPPRRRLRVRVTPSRRGGAASDAEAAGELIVPRPHRQPLFKEFLGYLGLYQVLVLGRTLPIAMVVAVRPDVAANAASARGPPTIWFLEGEGGANNQFVQLAMNTLGANYLLDNNSYYGVGVLNLWADSNHTQLAQDQLMLVPDGGTTVMLLGLGLLGLFVGRWKLSDKPRGVKGFRIPSLNLFYTAENSSHFFKNRVVDRRPGRSHNVTGRGFALIFENFVPQMPYW